jgi:hypothetical protein
LPQKSIGAVTSLVFSSCDLVDPFPLSGKQRRSTKNTNPNS